MAMAVPISLKLPGFASSPTRSKTITAFSSVKFKSQSVSTFCLERKHRVLVCKAVEESQEESARPEVLTGKKSPKSQPVESSELGEEIKKAMKERKEKEGEGDLWSGVAEEIREIEWPAFGKVMGTTGVVLGIIAGSSVVLLTVNAVLAELSDRVFAGKGVQDFFG
ncbi:preprotein translocase subunit SECE1 [Tripterygium wilfordii]|uniref:Preprotein translocase subunit SECE1 n=1 Tax=Tripterygium wilfordii TaxID=458696 RepID=A0A7J7CWX5_TRIWF|nr:preprotein translocase subunit SECE1 [Tripterygium wilfordii]KAF5738642.1 preprotein translocase subunit SECE1 [Tripterygium wilfordii]